MIIDDLGIPKFSTKEAYELLYSNQFDYLFEIPLEDKNEVDKFNFYAKEYDNLEKLKFYEKLNITQEEFDLILQEKYLIPQQYLEFDIEKWLYEKCDTIEEKNRVSYELKKYKEKNLINLLKSLKYLIDIMRQHQIIWGIGRGSSVASFVLFLIGIHRINPLKYDLDFDEFMI